MKFSDWLKSLGGGKKDGEPREPKKKVDAAHSRDVQTAADCPDVPGHRRTVVRDKRLLEKEPPKNFWDRPKPVIGAVASGGSPRTVTTTLSATTYSFAFRSVAADTA